MLLGSVEETFRHLDSVYVMEGGGFIIVCVSQYSWYCSYLQNVLAIVIMCNLFG